MPLRHAEAEIWLAFDAKFPTEDYDRMILANEVGDRDQENAAQGAGKAGAIAEILSSVKAEWAIVARPSTRRQNSPRLWALESATRRGAIAVSKALATVEALDPVHASQVLGLSEPALLIDAEPDEEDAAPLLTVPQPGKAASRHSAAE